MGEKNILFTKAAMLMMALKFVMDKDPAFLTHPEWCKDREKLFNRPEC